MFTIEYVKNMQWENADHTIFTCVVKYEEFNEEHNSGITLTDPYAHIHEIWNRAIAGEFGEIAEYVAPPPFPAPQEEQPATQGTQNL